MSLLGMLNIDIDGMVNNYIGTIFAHIARKQGVTVDQLEFIMKFDGKNGKNASKYIVITRNGGLTKDTFFLPDDEIRKLIQSAKK